MTAPSLLLVGFDAAARTAIAEAARAAWAEATLLDFPAVDDALKTPPVAGMEFLLLRDPAEPALTAALKARDGLGLPRWAVIVLGETPAGIQGVSAQIAPADEQPRLLAAVLRTVARLHELERENARLHGDLSTIGRRINHDLRAPLSAIYTTCEALDETLADTGQEHAILTHAIATSTADLTRLIERTSAIAKASADPCIKVPVSMNEIVFDTLQRVESRILRKGVTVTKPASWPKVMGVTAWLETVWLNLIENALRHATGAPEIELGWKRDLDRDEVRFWVNDRGAGVPPEKVGKLFVPFHQLHRLDAPHGLGLALVQRLVELQGGTCGYQARPEGGAHFYFTLPLSPMAE